MRGYLGTPRPLSDAQIVHLQEVLRDIDKPFAHFTVTTEAFLADPPAVYARAKAEQANFTTVNADGKPSSHTTLFQREWPDWEEDGPRLLATVVHLKKELSVLRKQLDAF